MHINKKLVIAIVVVIIVGACAGIFLSGIGGIKITDDNLDTVCAETADKINSGKMRLQFSAKSEDLVQTVIERVYDNPEMFWLDRNYSIISIGNRYIVSFDTYYIAHDFMMSEVNDKANEMLKDLPQGASDYEKALYIHDALCKSITYTDSGSEDEHNFYGALVNKKCVCEGYSKAFMYLMDMAGIETYYFSGTSLNNGVSQPHSWNGAYLDGEFYYFDLTWDDVSGNAFSYNDFAITSSEILRNHTFDEYHEVIETNSTKCNYFYRNDYVIEEYSDEVLAALIAKQGDIIDVKCASSIAFNELKSVVESPYGFNKVLSQSGNDNVQFSGFSYIADEYTMCVRIIFN